MTRKKTGERREAFQLFHTLFSKKKWRLIACGHIFIYAYVCVYIFIDAKYL